MGGSSKPPRSLEPDVHHHLVFLAIAPSFSSTLVHSFVFSSAFLFFSSFLCRRQPQTQQELGPSRLLLFFFFPLQQALAATSASWITKDTRLTHNE